MKFESVEILNSKIEDYFAEIPMKEQTITGLAIYLNTSRETLMNYENRDEFFDAIKSAKDRIEYAYEMRGLAVGGAFDIFRLKNMGWKDKTESEINAKVQVTKPSWFDDGNNYETKTA